jgi:hypothetical protein
MDLSDTAHSFSLRWVGVGGLCITQVLDVLSPLKAAQKLGVRVRESLRLHATDTVFCWEVRPVFG